MNVSLIASRLRRTLCQLPYLLKAGRMVFAASPFYARLWIISLFLESILPIAVIALSKAAIDAFVSFSRLKSPESFRSFAYVLIAAGGVLVISEFIRSCGEWLRASLGEHVQDHVMSLVHHQSARLDLAFYDFPDFHDHLHRARTDATYRPMEILERTGDLLRDALTLLGVMSMLARYGAIPPIALIISLLPLLAAAFNSVVAEFEWRQRATPHERRTWYYDWLLSAREAAAEIRVFDLGGRFASRYRDLRLALRSGLLALQKQRKFVETAASSVSILVTLLVLAWTLRRSLQGGFTAGDFVLLYQVFTTGQRLLRSILESGRKLLSNCFFLGNLFDFLALQNSVEEPAEPLFFHRNSVGSIEFSSVDFAYPGSSKLALRKFNLVVPPGQIVAIVGGNGAGKSTLIKLLTRLYDPSAGSIRLGGIDIRELATSELRRYVSVLFQSPLKFNDTVKSNILLQEITESAGRERTMIDAARAAGAHELICGLDAGYDTILGKEFMKGIDLSGGEWQRIALARGLARDAKMLLLDEPTSALDPWAEALWMERLRANANGRTILIITHRFTTAMRADTVHVMSGGQIVESGTHEELAHSDGLYAHSWRSQLGNVDRSSNNLIATREMAEIL